VDTHERLIVRVVLSLHCGEENAFQVQTSPCTRRVHSMLLLTSTAADTLNVCHIPLGGNNCLSPKTYGIEMLTSGLARLQK
jgi:hypothetical protein